MKKLLVLLMICCMCTACGTKEEAVVEAPAQAEEAVVEVEETEEVVEEAVVETPEAEEVVEEAASQEEKTVISPLPVTIDMNALDNVTLAVSFEKGDVYVDDTGALQMDVTVYTYDLYDMVDISTLKEGDIFVVQGNEVLVESVNMLESGLLFINGGIEEGGYDLFHNNSGVYFEHGMNDMKSYYSLGEATLRVSADFRFVDSSDFDAGEVTYYPGDFLIEDAGFDYYFNPNNTSIVVENGQVISMTRIFTP